MLTIGVKHNRLIAPRSIAFICDCRPSSPRNELFFETCRFPVSLHLAQSYYLTANLDLELSEHCLFIIEAVCHHLEFDPDCFQSCSRPHQSSMILQLIHTGVLHQQVDVDVYQLRYWHLNFQLDFDLLKPFSPSPGLAQCLDFAVEQMMALPAEAPKFALESTSIEPWNCSVQCRYLELEIYLKAVMHLDPSSAPKATVSKSSSVKPSSSVKHFYFEQIESWSCHDLLIQFCLQEHLILLESPVQGKSVTLSGSNLEQLWSGSNLEQMWSDSKLEQVKSASLSTKGSDS